MKPTDVLMREHEIILGALDLLHALALQVRDGRPQALEAAPELLDFIASYADALHHGKEEKMLFPALEEAGMPVDGGPIGVMLQEHEQGRALVRTMRELLPELEGAEAEARRRDFVAAAHGFVELLRQHIAKEDSILFPMGERILPEPERQRLAEAFERHDRHEHAAEFERCLGLLGRVRAAVGAPS